jgi:agmatinase
MEPVRQMVREVAQTGAIPFIIGGDHSLKYPNVAGIADVYGKESVGVVHFDAHYDAGKGSGGHLISHGTPIRRLINEGHVLGRNYIQVGLRGYWPGEEGFQWMREQGFRYHTMAEIEQDGWPEVMSRVLAEALDGPQHLYISLDIDVLDPAFTPGTGTPEPGGLTPRELFPLVRNLCARKDLVGFDLVEANPLVDPGYTTALNANRLLRECLTGVAMRKKGITEEGYLSPLTREHGRRPQN